MGRFQSFEGLAIHWDMASGSFRVLYLLRICCSKNEDVFLRVKLSAIFDSQDVRRGQWITWIMEPQYPLIRWAVRMRMEVYSSFLVYPSFIPNTQDMLSVKMQMWLLLIFSGINSRGGRRANISSVAVLLLNLFCLLSFAWVMNHLSHHDWYPSMVSPSTLVPMVPKPISEDLTALSGNPAASVQNFRVPSGGSMGSNGIGTQRSWCDRKFSHTARSFLLFELRVAMNLPYSHLPRRGGGGPTVCKKKTQHKAPHS